MTAPVFIITGFLGSGKTTLMNRLLQEVPEGHRPAIIVNDFGEVGVDGALLERSGYAMKELAAGCVCCTLRGPLSDSLLAIATEQQPDSILLETTGVAQPAQLLPIFQARALVAVLHVGNVVCVIDGSRFMRYREHFPIMSAQLSQANTVIINKTDLATAADIEAVHQHVVFLSQPDSVVAESEQCAVPLSLVYEERPVYFEHDLSGSPDHGHHLRSVSIEADNSYSLPALRALFQEQASSLVRAKGIVKTDAGAKLIQYSLSGLEISDWPAEPVQSRLVFIGPELDRKQLQACLRSAAEDRT
ncbi:MAG: GTP-binding protein [Lentisphaeria bacterium]|nr:GTP-binding protein [Lentisphaeria bacterium]